MNNLLQRLLTTGISVVGGLIGTKLVEFAWRQITGHDAPKDLDDTENNWVGAVVFATISAAIAALVRVGGQRGAASAMRRVGPNRQKGLGRGEV